jgi:hypothetical protein
LLRLRSQRERRSVRGPAIGQATTMPMKLLNVKRPRSAEENRYGGGEKRSGAIVEIMTTLGLLALGFYCDREIFEETYAPRTTPYMADAAKTPGTRSMGKGKMKR